MPYDKNGKYYRKPVYKVEKIKKDLPQQKNKVFLLGCYGNTAFFLVICSLIYSYLVAPNIKVKKPEPKPEPTVPKVDLPLCRKNQDPYGQSAFPLRLGIFPSCRLRGVNGYDWEYEKMKLKKMERINKRKLKKIKKPVKKDASTGSVKINCDSPVWKNKPRCN